MDEAVTFFFGSRVLDQFVLAPEDSHHAVRVLRRQPGDLVWCIDGRGSVFEVRLHHADARKAEGDILSESHEHGEAPARLTLVAGLTQPARFDWLVEKATELGVAEILPVRGSTTIGPGRVRRWQRIARSAAKQCRRGRVPDIGEPGRLVDLLGALPPGSTKLLADPAGERALPEVRAGDSVLLVVGPDRGFSDPELDTLRQSGFRAIGLGPRRLRAETAAVHLLSLVIGRLEAVSPAAR